MTSQPQSLLRRLARFTMIVSARIICFPVAGLMALLAPLWRFQIWYFPDETMRIVVDPDLIFRQYHVLGRPKRTTFIAVCTNPCNPYMLVKWRPFFPIIQSKFICRIIHAARPVFEGLKVTFDAPVRELWQNFFFDEAPPVLSLTREEHRRGEELLEQMGIGADDWIVGFQARDPSFRQVFRMKSELSLGGTTIRDCSVENYLMAADEVTKRGGFALRMNFMSTHPLQTDNPKIIDYSMKYRSDFLDLYISARQKFFIGNTSGLCVMPAAFDVPRVLANYIALGDIPERRDTIFIPKLYKWRDSGEYVTFPELEAMKQYRITNSYNSEYNVFFSDITYNNLGIVPIESYAEDIRDATVEMFEFLDGARPAPDLVEANEEYIARFLPHLNKDRYARKNRGRLSAGFVRKYWHLMQCSSERIADAARRWDDFEALGLIKKAG